MKLSNDILSLKMLGPKKAEALKRFEINKIGDFLNHYPKRYEDRSVISPISELREGQKAFIYGKIVNRSVFGSGIKKILKLAVEDSGASIEIVFFNATYLLKMFKTGSKYGFYGSVTVNNKTMQMLHPDFFANVEQEKGIIPVYPLTGGISQQDMRRWIRQILSADLEIEDILPEFIREQEGLLGIKEAFYNIHFPKSMEKLEQAKKRLVFEELFLLQLRLLNAEYAGNNEKKGIAFSKKDVSTEHYTKTLAFELTNAQKKAIAEIEKDMESESPMVRLLQGDVGSGKTAVAEACLYKAVKNGYQAVIMAPTELLARQHYDSMNGRFFEHGIRSEFLSGSVTLTRKKEIYAGIASGEIDVLIGTHAIIQEGVEFENLGLVVVDEQHRFGVEQRAKLSKKGVSIDVLLMTATPIPRSLAAVLFGGIKTSKLDELPPNRKTIETGAFTEKQRKYAYAKLLEEIKNGRQGYIVTPLIDYSESLEGVRSAETVFEGIRKAFPSIRPALIHGAMKQGEKDKIMSEFYKGEVDVLVATVVIEVGINVPNATVMLIENAERFGLAQLHQLRGRVGRGSEKSYCLLVNNGNTEISKERIGVMVRTSDGFEIAEKDLQLRGPGEFFGQRQHGLPELKIANLADDLEKLIEIKKLTEDILEKNPKLDGEEFSALRKKLYELGKEYENIMI